MLAFLFVLNEQLKRATEKHCSKPVLETGLRLTGDATQWNKFSNLYRFKRSKNVANLFLTTEFLHVLIDGNLPL